EKRGAGRQNRSWHGARAMTLRSAQRGSHDGNLPSDGLRRAPLYETRRRSAEATTRRAVAASPHNRQRGAGAVRLGRTTAHPVARKVRHPQAQSPLPTAPAAAAAAAAEAEAAAAAAEAEAAVAGAAPA